MSKGSNLEKEGVTSLDLNLKPEADAVLSDCCICVEPLNIELNGRIIVKLSCGHEFHFDCIGSAYNWKKKMECPICRNIEPGQWLYSSGPPNRDLVHDGDEFNDEGEEELQLNIGPVNVLQIPSIAASFARGPSIPSGPPRPFGGNGLATHGLVSSSPIPFGENGLGTSHGLGSSYPRHVGENRVATVSFLPYQYDGVTTSNEEWRDLLAENVMLQNQIDALNFDILADHILAGNESFGSGESSYTGGTCGGNGDNNGGSSCGGKSG